MKLNDYVQRVMRDKSLGLKDVERNSHGRISHGYVSDILTEKTTNPSVGKLKALALGLGVSEDEIFRVARGLPIEGDSNQVERLLPTFNDLSDSEQSLIYTLASFFKGLSEAEQTLIVEFARMILNRHRASEAARAAGKPEPPPEPIPFLEAIAIDADEEDESVTHAILIEEKSAKKRKPTAKAKRKGQ
jgi:transcriptional regulator with XRE-family HTH domain